MTEKILFVDDEPSVLAAIQRQLHGRFDIETATSGTEALQKLQKTSFALIVSDMRMPGMNGVELLSRVKVGYPEVVRMMLTGNADQATAIDATNAGQIFRFLTKPCSQATFVTAIALALRQHRLLTAERELLQHTLQGCVQMLADLLSLANPTAFSSSIRIASYVQQFQELLDIRGQWQYNLAAMMSHVGCTAFPQEVLEKWYSSEPLSINEQQRLVMFPQIGAEMIAKIPRLGNVAKMVQYQSYAASEFSEKLRQDEVEEVIFGAQLLKISADFDRQLVQGKSIHEAAAILRRTAEVYNLTLLEKLPEIKAEMTEVILSLRIKELRVGMMTVEDIRSKNGILIIPANQTLTRILLQSLQSFAEKTGVVEPIQVKLFASSAADEPARSTQSAR